MTTTVKANPKALEKALACKILAEVPGISIHTRAALRSISRRLIDVLEGLFTLGYLDAIDIGVVLLGRGKIGPLPVNASVGVEP